MISLLEQLLEKEDIFKPFTFEEWVGRMISSGVWTKNIDGTYSAEGDVNLSNKGLTKLPIRFKEVGGHFYCDHNQLTTLEGAPQKVGGFFDCSYNKLITLKGIGIVKGIIYCSNNPVPEKELLKTIGR